MNFDNAKFDVGNVYQDDPDKLHSDLIGINAISLEAEDTANEAESPNLVIQDASLKVCFVIRTRDTNGFSLKIHDHEFSE